MDAAVWLHGRTIFGDSAKKRRTEESRVQSPLRKAQVALTLSGLLSHAGAALAHHGSTMFDLTQERVLEGVVTEFAWRNPHAYLTLRTTGSNPVEQVIEVGPPATLRPLGLTQHAVRVGDERLGHGSAATSLRDHPSESSAATATNALIVATATLASVPSR